MLLLKVSVRKHHSFFIVLEIIYLIHVRLKLKLKMGLNKIIFDVND